MRFLRFRMRMAALGCVLTGVLLGAAPLSAQEIVADSITQVLNPYDRRALGWELDDGSSVVIHAEKNLDGTMAKLLGAVITTPSGETYEVVLDGATGDAVGSTTDGQMALYNIDESTLGVEFKMTGDEEAGVVGLNKTSGEITHDYSCQPESGAYEATKRAARKAARSTNSCASTLPAGTQPAYIQVNQCGEAVTNAHTYMSVYPEGEAPVGLLYKWSSVEGCHDGGGRYRFDIPDGTNLNLAENLAICEGIEDGYKGVCGNGASLSSYLDKSALCGALSTVAPVALACEAAVTAWSTICTVLEGTTTVCEAVAHTTENFFGDNAYTMEPYAEIPPDHCKQGQELKGDYYDDIPAQGPFPDAPPGWTLEGEATSCPVQNAKPSLARSTDPSEEVCWPEPEIFYSKQGAPDAGALYAMNADGSFQMKVRDVYPGGIDPRVTLSLSPDGDQFVFHD
ncbi:MAG: hypothetical protein VYE81_10905, partial [Planctomycetota bacterium]|nr:hypothetical protein [Planctomycetota bacterium]